MLLGRSGSFWLKYLGHLKHVIPGGQDSPSVAEKLQAV